MRTVYRNGQMSLRGSVRKTPWQLICVVVIAALSLPGIVSDAKAKARTETIDGVTWVHNSAEPEKGRQEIVLKERWRVGGDDEDEIFGVVAGVLRTDANEICILDNQLCELKFYGRDGEFLRTIGGRGEGPGEFLQGIGACLLPDGRVGVVQSFPGKVILFNADGTPGGEVIPRLSDETATQSYLVVYRAQRVGDRLAIACMDQQFGQEGMSRHHLLGLFDLDGTLLAPLTSSDDVVDMSQGYLLDEVTMTRYSERLIERDDGALVLGKDYHDYRIELFDGEGNPILGITRDYERIGRTDSERQLIEDIFSGFVRNVPNVRLQIEEDHKAVEEIHWGPDGELWALSGEGRWRAPEGVLATYDVFDSHTGHFVKQVVLKAPGDPRRDSVYPLGDQVLVVKGFLNSVVGMAGGTEGEQVDELEEEGITIICYDL